MRIDKWLFSVRLFKTRGQATEACRTGKVHLNDSPAKAAKPLRVGDTVSVRQSPITRTLKVVGLTGRRVGAKLVTDFAEDKTTPADLEKLRLAKRDAAFAKAEKASGTEKAKLLAEGLSLVDDEMALKTYGNVVSQIIELDAENKAGLKAKFAGLKDSVEFKSELEATMRDNHGKPEDTLAAIDKLIEEKKPTGAALQEAVFMKSSILFQTDKAKAKEMLLEAQKLAPKSETGKRINDILERFFKDE